MYHVKTETAWRLIPIDLPIRQPPRQSLGLQNLGSCQVNIPLTKIDFVIDPRIIPRDLFHLSIPKPPEITFPFSPKPIHVVPSYSGKVPRNPRFRRKEVTEPLSVQIPTQEPSFPLLPNLSSSQDDLPILSSHNFPLFPGLLKSKEEQLSSPESTNSLEEGEIRDTVSPVLSGE